MSHNINEGRMFCVGQAWHDVGVRVDEALTSEYGGWVLVCDGTHWHDCSHSKHV